jgi:hypothetical protein
MIPCGWLNASNELLISTVFLRREPRMQRIVFRRAAEHGTAEYEISVMIERGRPTGRRLAHTATLRSPREAGAGAGGEARHSFGLGALV